MIARFLLALLGGRADDRSPEDTDPTDRPVEDRLLRAMDERVLVTLRPISGMLAVLFVVFFVYNLVDLPPPLRELTVVYDMALVAISAALFQLLVQRRFPVRFAHPAVAMLSLAVVGNILMVMSGMREGLYTVYIDIVVIGAGSTMLNVRALATVLATVWLAWLPLAVHTIDEPRMLGIFAFTLFASTSLSSAIMLGRIRSERALHALRQRERQRTQELEEALRRAEEARTELDDKVAERTRELADANAALQRQIEGRRILEEHLHSRQRLEAVGQLAGGVAHEFNNVLTAVRGNLDILADEPLTELQHDVMGETRAAVDRGADVTRQLLAFGRRQVLEKRDIDLERLVAGMEGILQRLVQDHVELGVETLHEELWVHADPSQLELSVLNLVVNARDALPDGGHITLRLRSRTRDGERLAGVEVIDDGTGMDEETLAQVCDPFFTTKGDHRGSGLGLSTVYGIAEQHDGELQVSSELGKGTRVELWLPRATPPSTRRASNRPNERHHGSGTILLVEDDATVRRVGERILQRLGYEVLSAANGQEALELAASHAVDLLWTDVLMPGMSGVELVRRARSHRPELPVLLSSGYTGRALSHEDLPDGCHFLSKPYSTKELGSTVAGILRA